MKLWGIASAVVIGASAAILCFATPAEKQVEDWCDELRIRAAVYDWCLKGGCKSEARVLRYHERARVAIELCGAQIKSAQKPSPAQ